MDLDSNLLNNNFLFVINFSSENGNSNAFTQQNSKKFGLNKYAAKIEISTAHVLCLSEFQELVAAYIWWCFSRLFDFYSYFAAQFSTLLRSNCVNSSFKLSTQKKRTSGEIKFSMQSTFVEFSSDPGTGEGRLSPPISTCTPNVFHLPASLLRM